MLSNVPWIYDKIKKQMSIYRFDLASPNGEVYRTKSGDDMVNYATASK